MVLPRSYIDYLVFLKYSLGRTVTLPENLTSLDWNGLYSFACNQAIAGVCYQGILKVNTYMEDYEKKLTIKDVFNDNRITEEQMMTWANVAKVIERRNIRANEAVSRFASYMRKRDLGFFVFKGQTVGCLYEWPEARTSGDVDFYVCQADWNKMLDDVSRRTNCHFTDKHVEFSDGGIAYEMHHSIATFAKKTHQHYWDCLVEEDLALNRRQLVHDGQKNSYQNVVNIADELVPTLSPTIYAVYLFVHIYHHFMKEGVGLRQFCDWLVFLRVNKNKIDRSKLHDILETLGYVKAYKAFGCILVDQLGLAAEEFPYVLGGEDRKWEKAILDVVFSGGNFGQYGRRTAKAGILHSVETGFRSIAHVCRFYSLSPQENLLLIPKLLSLSLKKRVVK